MIGAPFLSMIMADVESRTIIKETVDLCSQLLDTAQSLSRTPNDTLTEHSYILTCKLLNPTSTFSTPISYIR
jgi:hypothetical protein